MYAEERQQAIASLVISQGRASVAELAETYDVTTETVRRDLAVLDRAGLVRRVHGGAVPVRALRLVEPGVGERENTRAEHKDAIAAAAAEFFPLSGASVLLDAGTTTSRIAAALPSDRELNVVTNSVPIAARLAGMPSVSLQLLGGRVRGLTQAAVGEQVLRVLDTLRVDIAFIGTNGISVRHGLSTPDSDEAAVKRAMIASANYVVVAADSSKVGREDFVSFAPLSSVDALITDSETQRRLPRPAHRAGHRSGRRMIVTVTPNPSIDRTVTLATPLTRGAVHRVSSVTTEPGGKGVNVARALTLAGVDAVALLPASGTDPMVAALQGSGVPFRCVPITAPVRTNIAVTEMDGTTTKINEPGAEAGRGRDRRAHPIGRRQRRARIVGGDVGIAAAGHARHAGTPTSSRSSPPTTARSRSTPPIGPLAALVDGFDRAAPDLIKPNAEELAGVIGFSPQALEAAVAQGDPEPVVSAAQRAGRPRRRRRAGHPRAPREPCW